ERGDVDCVRSVIDDRRARELDRVLFVDRPQRVPQTRVDDERALAATLLERVVVDDKRVVVTRDSPLREQGANAVVVRAWALSRPHLLVRVLSFALLEAADGKVEELDRIPAA